MSDLVRDFATPEGMDPDVAKACAYELAPTATTWGSSRFALWRKCARAHWLKYEQGVHVRESAYYFALGRLLHAVIAYKARAQARGLDADWRDMIEFLWAQGDRQERILAEVERLCSAYFAHYGEALAGFEA